MGGKVDRRCWRYAKSLDNPVLARRDTGPAFGVAADWEEIDIYADDLWSFSDLHRLDDSIPANLRERQFTVYGIAHDCPLADELRRLLPRVRLADPAGL